MHNKLFSHSKKVWFKIDSKSKWIAFIFSVFCLVEVYSSNDERATFSQQNPIIISGSVTDQYGEPLPGVNIFLKDNSSDGVTSDFNGNYKITVNSESDILVFSYLGFQTLEYQLGGSQVVNVVLLEDIQQLDQVVVVGYGVMKKSDLVGSVTSVKVDDFINTPTSDVQNMLKGRAAGVQVTLNNAEPGGNSSILIRGKRSIEGSNNPLVIVDGVPVNSMDDVNPNTISSIEVLKDAASQSIYGARASNGVILITSKKGEKGKLRFSYDGYVTTQNLWRNFKTFNGYEFAQLKERHTEQIMVVTM